MMSFKNFLKKNWNYIIAFLIPWILIVIHSIVRQSWLSGNGSILNGESGTIYYELYIELWNKVHKGGSLLYTWNAGGGLDFLHLVFEYLLSPFTILVLLVPQTWIANLLQCIMVLKWSLFAVSLLYYFMHSECNTIKYHKQLLALTLTSCVVLGNVGVQSLAYMNRGDVLIIFPLLLLWEEYMHKGKGFKRFYVCLTMCILFNFRMAIPMTLFLIVWYIYLYCDKTNYKKNNAWRFAGCVVCAVLSAMVVVIPCVHQMSDIGKQSLKKQIFDRMGQVRISIVDIVQRFFFGDNLLVSEQNEAMLYMSIVGIAIAMLFIFVPMIRKKKITCVLLFILLILEMVLGAINVLLHGIIGIGEQKDDCSFLLVFLLTYMCMIVLENMDQIHIWQVCICLIAGVALITYTFFHIQTYRDFYVYLISFLLLILISILMIFYCKKSIQYKNWMIVFSVLCLGELMANVYVQLAQYNMYPIEDVYYHKQSEILSTDIQLRQGARVAVVQDEYNYGMIMQKSVLSVESDCVNQKMQQLFTRLGMSENEKAYGFFGGSPLLNLMFDIQYGVGQNEIAFSNANEIEENEGCVLYNIDNQDSFAYVVDQNVKNWDVTPTSPFDVQNNFVKTATGGGDIFSSLQPDIIASSLLGGDRLEKEMNHQHEEGEEENEAESPDTKLEYDKEKQQYHYIYRKMYSEDVATATFEADGISDYYIFVTSEKGSVFSIMIDDKLTYQDAIASKQKTFHLGKVDKGTMISVVANANVDDLELDTVTYQIAAFDEKMYTEVEKTMLQSKYQITKFDDTSVEGKVSVKQEGWLMTSIPQQRGWKVFVDDEEVDSTTIGEALLAVPISKGEHTVRFQYQTPCCIIGAVISLLGIVTFCIGNQMISNCKKEQQE